MRLTFIAILTLMVLITLGQAARADLANCFVMAICSGDKQLSAEQQRQIGERIARAHEQSRASAEDMMFMVWIGRQSPDEVYIIGEANVKFGDWPVPGYRITAPDFAGLLQAVAEVEQAFKVNRIFDLKSGVRTQQPDSPLYE